MLKKVQLYYVTTGCPKKIVTRFNCFTCCKQCKFVRNEVEIRINMIKQSCHKVLISYTFFNFSYYPWVLHVLFGNKFLIALKNTTDQKEKNRENSLYISSLKYSLKEAK